MQDLTPLSPQPKTCTTCGEIKPATTEFFYRQSAKKDGLNPICKSCINRQHAEYREANPDKVKASKIAEYERNKDKYIERAAEWVKNNRARDRELRRKAWVKNKEHIRQQRREREASSLDAIRERKRQYKFANRERTNELARVNAQKRLARKRGLPDSFTSEEWLRCLSHFGSRCVVCGSDTKLQMDHWIPLNNEGCPGTIPTNIVCLCSLCNYSKRDRVAIEWLIEKLGNDQAEEISTSVQKYFDSIAFRS